MPSSIFASDYAATGFAIALVFFFLCEQIGGVIILAIRRGGARVQRRNVGSNIMVLVSWIFVIAFSVVFAKVGIAMLPD